MDGRASFVYNEVVGMRQKCPPLLPLLPLDGEGLLDKLQHTGSKSCTSSRQHSRDDPVHKSTVNEP